ncbi:MAG: glycoside hydrolase family 9 protein, partial [Deltaproteobacteria bacterium]|nr:glycoside hydrolase family 9 protein [Deltaproteobacteria bacterium]
DADRTLEEQDGQAARAAVYLFALTGSATYNTYFVNNYDAIESIGWGWWGAYDHADNGAAMFYTTVSGANATVVNTIRNSRLAGANDTSMYAWNANDHLYRAYMWDDSFHWGHNNARATTGNINMEMINYNLNSANHATYRKRALELLHWFHGVNALGKVMLSNMYDFGAENSVNEFYHSWFTSGTTWDNVNTGDGPAPGFLVGGPNASYSGGVSPPAGEPREKCYIDSNDINKSWEVSENGIYYQAAYTRLVAWFASNSN